MESLETGNPVLDSAESVAPVAAAPRARAPKASYADFLESLLVTILLALFGTTFILQAFKFPFDDHPHYVKRVIGLPGDRIRIVDQQVYVDGVRLIEPYVVHDPSADDPYADNFPPSDAGFPKWG